MCRNNHYSRLQAPLVDFVAAYRESHGYVGRR
ncbi:hypothetical protein LCGC14_0698920 [marine sediment metagenome]|uniref:Uncharacterized protein n=1 Tax=marine sediment metagenome TaxID=412755 RepID=A0A0F9TR75_9ZZZZ